MSTFALNGRMGHVPSRIADRARAWRSRLAASAPSRTRARSRTRAHSGTSARACTRALVLAAAGAFALSPTTALAAPPPNDHYLASTIIRDAKGGFPREWTGTADTTEATTQADLFEPNREGQPLGGGTPEPLTCGGATLDKTVWWDLTPPLTGAFELRADGFDTTLAVYEFDTRSSKILRQVACSATPGAPEKLVLPETLKAGRSYTVQVGGAVDADGNAPAGALTLGYSYFPDRDDDGILDVLPDRCPDLPGVDSFGGCPPTLKPVVSYTYRRTAGGLTLEQVRVTDVPAGAKVRVRAGRYRSTRVATGDEVVFTGASSTRLRNGAALEIRATLDRGTGLYVHGAIGADVRFKVAGGKLGRRTSKCLVPGDGTPRKSCKRVKR